MNTYQEIAASPALLALPEWLQELRTGLAVRSQFVVSGNIRDLFPVQGCDGPAFVPASEAIWSVLKQRGYTCLLNYDPVAGTRLHHECDDALLPLLRDAGIKLDTPPRDLKALAEQMRLVASNKRMTIVVAGRPIWTAPSAIFSSLATRSPMPPHRCAPASARPIFRIIRSSG
jgi:hypothetical protein